MTLNSVYTKIRTPSIRGFSSIEPIASDEAGVFRTGLLFDVLDLYHHLIAPEHGQRPRRIVARQLGWT